MFLTEDKEKKTEQINHTYIIFILQEQENIIRQRRKKGEEKFLGNSILELIVIFQLLIFVFPIFCKHRADQKYP